jgi:arylsulfatase A-like enzyme
MPGCWPESLPAMRRSVDSVPTPTHRTHLLGPVVLGTIIFLALQYGLAIWRLVHSSSEMSNKFSVLARSHYLKFLIGQNLQVLIAYAVLGMVAVILVLPIVARICRRTRHNGRQWMAAYAFVAVSLLHGYFMLRLTQSRPYFLPDATFGSWYYKMLDWPDSLKPALFGFLFTILPIVFVLWTAWWYLRRPARFPKVVGLSILAISLGLQIPALLPKAHVKGHAQLTGENRPMNILFIGSDSLRGDKLGVAGYVPSRSDGPAKEGVSPTIDELASRSIHFERCYTPIASTMESSITLMTSQYPHTHGIRQMYPDQASVETMEKTVTPVATVMAEAGYDTAAIGDWCAGYYEVVPLGFEDISVSNHDNFKVYMSQAVMMAHFVIPLYFDNPLGYRMFPQIGSFASFVTPDVVTARVEKRLHQQAETGRPFFWHVFYSCNHLPYRSSAPYNQMFTDPDYRGRNAHGVVFDINEFIGGTDLESKWNALPPEEVNQIRNLYDGCTRQFDDCVKRILESLKRSGLDQNTIVVITSDHGDDLYEPGVTLGHGLTFNGGGQANHVPMIIHVPGESPKVIPETIRTIDVMPTLADLVGMQKPANWEGSSVAGWIRGDEQRESLPFYGETGFPFIQFTVPGIERPKLPTMDELTYIDENYNYQFVLKEEYRERLVEAKQRCLITGRWKLVCTPTKDGKRHYALYELSTDESGGIDRANERPEVLLPMRSALDRWIDSHEESTLHDIFPDGEPQ